MTQHQVVSHEEWTRARQAFLAREKEFAREREALAPDPVPSNGMLPRGIRAERDQRNQRERQELVRALAAAQGNKAEAARALGMARSTLLSRLKKHGLS